MKLQTPITAAELATWHGSANSQSGTKEDGQAEAAGTEVLRNELATTANKWAI